MRKARNWSGDLSKFLKSYSYRLALTARLDSPGPAPFDQQLINEIVLWKVNRYAEISPGGLEALNGVAATKPGAHRKAKKALLTLLEEPGIDLPLASTFLRFRNPETFQIIDRHAYRAVYGKGYPLYSTSDDDEKATLYFDYLDELLQLSASRGVRFRDLGA